MACREDPARSPGAVSIRTGRRHPAVSGRTNGQTMLDDANKGNAPHHSAPVGEDEVCATVPVSA